MSEESFVWLITRVTCVAWDAKRSEDYIFRRCLRLSLLHFLNNNNLISAMLAHLATVTAVDLSRKSSTV